MKSNVFYLVILYINLCFAGDDVVFIGLHGEGAPAVEKTFDRLLREHLSVLPDIHSVDYIQAQRYGNMIQFNNYPTVSSDLVQSLSTFASDTTLFVWGTIKEYRIKPVRRALFFARLKAELTLGLNMYSLSRRGYAYSGNVKVEAYKPKGVIGFSPVEKVIHISALDRAELLEKLEYDAVQATGRMISAVVRSQSSLPDSSGVNTYKVPEISDVFSVPSVDAAMIDSAGQKQNDGTSKNVVQQNRNTLKPVQNTTAAIDTGGTQNPDTTSGKP